MGKSAQGLAQQALGPITINGGADTLTGHKADTEGGSGWPGLTSGVPPGDKNDKRVGVRSTIAPHPLEVGCTFQPDQRVSGDPGPLDQSSAMA